MARLIAGSITIDGRDDERGRDERVHRRMARQMVLDTTMPMQEIQIPDVRWGGECRVELTVTAQAIGNGAVVLNGHAKLFEGASESTDDLEKEESFTFTLPRSGRPSNHSIYLRSDERGHDDATIRFSFTNSLVED